MNERRKQVWIASCLLFSFFAFVLAGLSGCGVINPALLGSVGGVAGSSVGAIDSPEGFVAIVVMNMSISTVQVNIDVTKRNGGVVPLRIIARPFSTANDFDHVVAIQECDIANVQLVSFTYTSTGGSVEIPSDIQPLALGQTLFCGDVIGIQILGIPPNMSFQLQVF